MNKIILILGSIILAASAILFLPKQNSAIDRSITAPSGNELKISNDKINKQKDFKNVILIGWDGAQRDHLNELLKENKLPNYKNYFLDNGSCVNTVITTGKTETKPGWAEILTGYDSQKIGILSNFYYKPIPKGYTIFERLEDYFGKENIITMFITGKTVNTGARGSHKICINCKTRDPLTRKSLKYWDENSIELVPRNDGEKPLLEQREGEPYYITKNNIDVYISDLGQSQNVFKKAIEYLDTYGEKRFFMFLHYEEPDEQGHLYGENSGEYGQAIVNNDKLLEDLAAKLKQIGIYNNTILYLTTDHGMNEGAFNHSNAPDTFFCASEKGLAASGVKAADRKDITPTILDRYKLNLGTIVPPLDGLSLYEKNGDVSENDVVRIGYFDGGRIHLFYRTYINKYFQGEGVDVKLLTKYYDNDNSDPFYEVPGDYQGKRDIRKDNPYFGRATGLEIVDRIIKGELDGGTIGESSFVKSVSKNLPIIAVATLGHDVKNEAGKVIVVRKGVEIKSSEDFEGKTFMHRKTGPGDTVMLKEFLASEGIDASKVKIISKFASDELDSFRSGEADAGYLHLLPAKKIIEAGYGYLYKNMDWVNPEISNAVLVFRKDFLEKNPDKVEKIITAYLKRIRFEEYEVSEEEKDSVTDHGLAMKLYYKGLSIPQTDLVPTVNPEYVKEMRSLLYKYGEIESDDFNVENYIDNSYVMKIAEQLDK